VIGPELVRSSHSDGISFTGSNEVGRRLAADAAACGGKSAQCEMGGRNAIMVMADADLDAALEAVLVAGFGTTGQRCTSSSRVIIETPVYDAFVDRLVEAAQALRVGPGLDPATEMGPLVSAKQLESVLSDLERGAGEGVEIICGGRRLDGSPFEHGHFMEPTVTTAPVDSWFTNHEVFGPVVTVFPAASYEEAIALNNAVPHGLSSGIFTTDLGHANRFLRETDTGMAHVNRPTVGAEAHLPFGGAKESSIGPPELGAARAFFTKTRSAHVRWS
jgi:aldehyde dehydrogenase (NAD+)